MDQVDLSKIQCIPHHQTLAILNQYLITGTNHINKMTDYSQKEMLQIDFMIDELERKVQILQRKIGISQIQVKAGSQSMSNTQEMSNINSQNNLNQ